MIRKRELRAEWSGWRWMKALAEHINSHYIHLRRSQFPCNKRSSPTEHTAHSVISKLLRTKKKFFYEGNGCVRREMRRRWRRVENIYFHSLTRCCHRRCSFALWFMCALLRRTLQFYSSTRSLASMHVVSARSRKICEKLKTQLESSSYSFDVEVLNVHVFWFKCSCLLGCSFHPDHNIFLSFSPLILTWASSEGNLHTFRLAHTSFLP